MIFIIDNTKNLKKAYMTPLLLKYLDKLHIKYIIASDRERVNKIIKENKNNKFSIKGIILTGGPLCLSEELTIALINKNIATLLNFKKIPVLGICFGFQIITASYGGEIKSMEQEDTGIFRVKTLKDSILLKGLDNTFQVYQSHKDKVVEVPFNFDILGIDHKNNIQIIENIEDKIWGVQFHPEGLEETQIIIKNFIDICYL
jgi:GMP synthase (glutamine-hydrolysing) A subunit